MWSVCSHNFIIVLKLGRFPLSPDKERQDRETKAVLRLCRSLWGKTFASFTPTHGGFPNPRMIFALHPSQSLALGLLQTVAYNKNHKIIFLVVNY